MEKTKASTDQLPIAYEFKGGVRRSDGLEVKLNGRRVPGVEVWARGIKDKSAQARALYAAAPVRSVLIAVEHDDQGRPVEMTTYTKVDVDQWRQDLHEVIEWD